MKNRIPVAVVAVLLMSLAQVLALVTITQPPTNQSVSIGANVTNTVVATSTAPPLTYQWYFTNAPLPGATNQTLALPNIQLAQASEYYVVVSDADLSPVNSDLARIDVDPTFTQITTGPLVTDTAGGWNASWIDYDGDGRLDVTVAPKGDITAFTRVFHHEGDGTFRKVLTNAIAQTAVRSWSHVWADYDNDGRVDLFVPNANTMNDMLFHNNGNGSFTRITTGHPVIDGADSITGVWGDYDRDGFIDLFVTTWGGPFQADLFYRNHGDGTFRKLTSADVGTILTGVTANDFPLWTDVDNDGVPELYRSCYDGSTWWSELWRQNAQGQFTMMDLGELQLSGGITWADYDNDGFLDACTGGGIGQQLGLFRNLAGQGFTDVTAGAGLSSVSGLLGFMCDYDNDGWQDIFAFDNPKGYDVFRNNGDGTFSPRSLGGPTEVMGPEGAWLYFGDYNNDGFLDALVLYGPNRQNSVFQHNGNTNHWLKVKLDGRASNRSGIGAKVRALATIGGRTFWQMREISGQGVGLDNGLIAHFGLGDATNVTTLRIEWPSGIVQELTNVAANQFLTNVVEHLHYSGPAPVLGRPIVLPNSVQLPITEPAAPAVYALEASSDLVNWTKLMARTSAGGMSTNTNAFSMSISKRFYRVVVP